MTSTESINVIRMLLDSDHEYYYSLTRVIEAVNTAQNMLIHTLNMSNDERGLRPLYENVSLQTPLADGATLPADCMYPKGLNIFPVRTNNSLYYSAEYLDYDRYINLSDRPGAYMTGRFPHSIYWTYTRQHNIATSTQDTILLCTVDSTINSSNYKALMAYIRRPALFNQSVPISLPSEYHYSVVSLAAELINNIDINEMERGQIAYPQQQGNTLINSGELG